MQAFTQKYAIIQLFEDVPEGTQFFWKDWPLHSTLVDVFAVDWNASTMGERLEASLASHTPATSVAMGDTFFGPDKQIRVVLLEKTPSLVRLHQDIITVLEQGGFKPNNPEFVRDGFLPHSTVQKHTRLRAGDSVVFDALTIIDFFPRDDPYQRKILKTIKISP